MDALARFQLTQDREDICVNANNPLCILPISQDFTIPRF
jgi:hypothetical protein